MTGRQELPEFAGDFRGFETADGASVPMGCAARKPAVLCGTLFGVVSALDKDRLHDVLDEAVIVIDAEDFERSQKDPRIRELFNRGQALHAELDSQNANF